MSRRLLLCVGIIVGCSVYFLLSPRLWGSTDIESFLLCAATSTASLVLFWED